MPTRPAYFDLPNDLGGCMEIWEIAKRGGSTLNIAGRREIEAALRKGGGGIWLDLTPEQYAKLRTPLSDFSANPNHHLEAFE